MTIHHIVHVEGLNALTDLVQMIYEKLNDINARNIRSVEVIDGKDPAVQKALGIQEAEPGKPMNTRRRWTAKEDSIVIIGYSKGLAPAAISEILKQQGFDRSAHAIVDHMSELRKLMK